MAIQSIPRSFVVSELLLMPSSLSSIDGLGSVYRYQIRRTVPISEVVFIDLRDSRRYLSDDQPY